MSKFYYKKEEDKECFLEVSRPLGEELFNNEYLEIGRKIKYRFLNFLPTDEYEELGYYGYKKVLDNAINNL